MINKYLYLEGMLETLQQIYQARLEYESAGGQEYADYSKGFNSGIKFAYNIMLEDIERTLKALREREAEVV